VAIDTTLVTRAQHGERAGFDELFRLHAHPAWRLAIAVGGSAEIAEQAVVEAFTNVFRRLQGGSATVGTPFRLLVARAAADAAAGASASGLAPVPADGPNALATMFQQMPRQWRAVLWLTDVEGGSSAQAGTLLGLSADDAAALTGRARAGLRQRVLRTGDPSTVELLGDIAGNLRPIVTPMPVGVATAAGAWWEAWYETTKDDRRHGLAGFLSLGPRAERVLAGAAAVVLAAGIASAIALGGDEATRRSPSSTAAGSGELAGGTTVLSDSIDGGTGTGMGTMTSSKTWARNSTGRGEAVSGATSSSPLGATPAPVTPRTPTTPGITTPPTQPPAVADSVPPGTGANIAVDAAGTPIAVGVGDQTGVQVGPIVIGTPPSAPAGGVSIEVGTGGLLPPITILLP
jgi:DNA-directed RNA polymerase specialized sigma24 family protein